MKIYLNQIKNIKYKNSINQLYNSVIWTHKIQRSYLEKLEIKRKTFEIVKIIIVSLSVLSTSLFAIYSNQVGTIVSAVFVFISTVVSEILDKIETKENIKLFKQSSEKLYELKLSLILLSDEIKNYSITEEAIKNKLEFYQYIFNTCVSGLPEVPNKTIKKATKKLKDRKDEELDFTLL